VKIEKNLSLLSRIVRKSSTMLTLKRASKSRPSGQWSNDDYDVFDGDRHIGRILLTHAAPADRRSTPAVNIRSNSCCFALHCLSLDGTSLGADRCPYSK
jgi:hypothetical protein